MSKMITGVGQVTAVRSTYGFIKANSGTVLIFQLNSAHYSPVLVDDYVAWWTRNRPKPNSKYVEARRVVLIESARGAVKLGF
jgi:hypothetical protein